MNKVVREDSQDFLYLFLNDIPLMDVRAPVEFIQGAFPTANNRPLLNDQQRQEIGIRYKNAGPEEAIKLGLELATDDIRQQRLQSWIEFCQHNPEGYLYCFRGGLRSHTTQQWLQEKGIQYPLISGGYKAMRRFLIDQLDVSLRQVPLILLSGPTGSGKTRVLKRIKHFIDLEGLAEHRGSAFGRTLAPQPSQIDWENRVSIELLKHHHRYSKTTKVPVMLEDEGRLIGRVALPNQLKAQMKQSNLIVLERQMASRVKLIKEDYISQQWPDYIEEYGELGFEKFSEFVLGNLYRIRKRLGGVAYQQVKSLFQEGLRCLSEQQDSQAFEQGIEQLLTDYYDPMYRYQQGKREGKILFSGSELELIEWTNDYLEKVQ